MKGKQSTKKINSLMKKLNWRMTPPPPVNLKKLIFITTNWPKMMMRGVLTDIIFVKKKLRDRNFRLQKFTQKSVNYDKNKFVTK